MMFGVLAQKYHGFMKRLVTLGLKQDSVILHLSQISTPLGTLGKSSEIPLQYIAGTF